MNAEAVLRRQVLVLNNGWVPVNVTTVWDSIILVFNERARFVDPETFAMYSWEGWVENWADAINHARVSVDRIIRSPNTAIVVPEVIVATEYKGLGVPMSRHGTPKFSRRNIFLRDKQVCAYCGKKFDSSNLNIDHVIPRSQGGHTSWTNVVLSCFKCNDKKGGRTPEEAGMRLRYKPRVPEARELHVPFMDRIRRKVRGRVPKSWEALLGKLYWQVELTHD